MAMVNEFFNSNSLSQDLVEAVCTDGTAAMLGKNPGSIGLIKKINPNVMSLHSSSISFCIQDSYLQDMLDVVQAVNLI
jgi:hypothetical protein